MQTVRERLMQAATILDEAEEDLLRVETTRGLWGSEEHHEAGRRYQTALDTYRKVKRGAGIPC